LAYPTNISGLRMAKKWSQGDLAKEIKKVTGIRPAKSRISEWETGTRILTPEQLRMLAEIFDVSEREVAGSNLMLKVIYGFSKDEMAS
jgi:transcriptional regulator with XRE-family HTH domain